MTSTDSPGDLRMPPRPPDGSYADLTMPMEPVQAQPETRLDSPEPVISLTEPRVAIGLAALALLIGFALATLLFGVILRSDDSEAIAGTGTDAPTVADDFGADPAAPQQAVGTEDLGSIEGGMEDGEDGVSPLNADGSDALVVGAGDDGDAAMADSTTSSTAATTTTVPTTIAPTTAPPTSAATTAPTTATAPDTSAAPTTAAATTQATVSDTPAPGPSGGDGAFQQQVLELTNIERAKAGCGAVILDPTLNSVADAHSEDMAANQYFDHTGRNGSQPWDRVQAAGYPARGSGENIAQGYSSAADVMVGWMNSPGHRRNILNCDWTELGVGYAEGGSSGRNIRPLYWTQVFATRG